jgi:hypothetical protein
LLLLLLLWLCFWLWGGGIALPCTDTATHSLLVLL